jgi:hypothetical protein
MFHFCQRSIENVEKLGPSKAHLCNNFVLGENEWMKLNTEDLGDEEKLPYGKERFDCFPPRSVLSNVSHSL